MFKWIPERNLPVPDNKDDLIPERADFDVVVMPREELITKMQENRTKHEEAFNAAMEGFSVKAKEELEEALQRMREGNKAEVAVFVRPPENHLADYDAYIQALQVQKFEEVRLPMNEWRCYFLDEWSWKKNWTTSNSDYIALSSRSSAR